MATGSPESRTRSGRQSVERRLPKVKCDVLPCFNGGECWQKKFCDCSRYNASGSRCQIVYNTGPERENICRTWGQYHYETFDGLYFFFPGKFTYDLLRQAEPDEQRFSIQVHNDPSCASHPYSCARFVTLYFAGAGEVTLQEHIVLLNNLRVQLPYTSGVLRIQRLAGYIIITQHYAFSLAWDGNSAIYLKMSPDYVGRTHGICGNNNWIPHDDLVTSYGKVTEDIEEFVNSWREDLPQKLWLNPAPSTSYEPPCAKLKPQARQVAHSLCSSLLQPPFQSCHELVSPEPFMASCADDLCMSEMDMGTLCRALAEYARACAHAGHPLQGWREVFKKCDVTCDTGLVYKECIECCPTSCHLRKPCMDSEISCVDGCYCPEGMVLENETCVHPSECPCDFHGVPRQAGTVVQDQCNNCTCSEGKWVCTELTCPAECSVTGDFHIMTFDGRKYTFQAPCQYILAKSLSSGTFTVSLQNAPCGPNLDGSCIQSVNIIVHQDQRKEVILTQSGDVFVYEQYKVNLPYTDDVFEIRAFSSVFVRVKTSLGLQLLYDRGGLRLYLQVDERWKDDTTGLCGTFNDNTQDDFLSPAGVPESTPQLFGNSWKTSSACGTEYLSSRLDPCDVHLQAASYAAESCSVISSGDLFAPCHSYLSPVSYYEQCRRDTCKCGDTCLCSALAHYAHQCRHFGVTVNFRGSVPSCDIPCEGSMVYSTCVSPCARTCQSMSAPEVCEEECMEGCACPDNMYYSTQLSTCVERSRCPCYFQGINYQPGENVITSIGKCLCMDGVMKCESSAAVHSCPDGQIYRNCSSSEVDIALSPEKTCENQLLNVSASSSLPCVSVCVCPRGLVKHGTECLEPAACPCSWKAKEYFPGDIVHSPCHTCVCQHGAFQCSFHPCPSMCTFYADRHYRTFDGFTFDFVGNCKVHLVKARSPSNFSVTAENVNCFSSGAICRKVISISVGRSLILLNDDTGMPNPSSVIDTSHEVHVWQAGFFTFIHFPSEYITLLWDQRTALHIQAGPQWQGALSGLCGNFDLKTVNEMRTPENLELSNPQEFGTSWTASECLDSPDTRDRCRQNPLREPFAKKQCGILLSEVFEDCHPVVDVTWFYSNCLSDTCGCNLGGDCECFCTSVSAYAHQCCQQGVTVDWRSPRTCPYDCEFYNKVLGKGPYRLHSQVDRNLVLAVRMTDATVLPMREERAMPGHAADFMITPGLFSPRAHDKSIISLEVAERPNIFLHLGRNGTLQVSKWQRSDEFQRSATFIIHKNRWTAGYSAFESLAKPGHFVRVSAASIFLAKYHHSAAFRLATLFMLSDSKLRVVLRSSCEWRYDACSSACYRTCRDPAGERCNGVPRVEGCFPWCPPDMVADEVTKKCVYFPDCIESAVSLTTSTTMKVTSSPAAPVTGAGALTAFSTRPVSSTTISAAHRATPVAPLHTTTQPGESSTDIVRTPTQTDIPKTRTPTALPITTRTQATSGEDIHPSHVSVPRTVTTSSPSPGTISTETMSSSVPSTLTTSDDAHRTLTAWQNVTRSADSSPTAGVQISRTVTHSEQSTPSTGPMKLSSEPHTSTSGSTDHTVSQIDQGASLPPSRITSTHYTMVPRPPEKATSVTGITRETSQAVETTGQSTLQTFLMSTKLVTETEISHAKDLTESVGGITQTSGVSSVSQKITKSTTEAPQVYSVLPFTTSQDTRSKESFSGYPPGSSPGLVTISVSSIPAQTQPTSVSITLSTRPSTAVTFTSKETSLMSQLPTTEGTRLAPTPSASSQATSSEHTIYVEGTKLQRSEAITMNSTSETAITTITTKIAPLTSVASKEARASTELTSHGTRTSNATQMSTKQGTGQPITEPIATAQSTRLILDLRNVTGPIKSTPSTRGALSPTDLHVYDTKLPPTYPSEETSQQTSQPGLLTRTSSISVTMVPDLSVTLSPTYSKTIVTLSSPASDRSLFYTSRTTQSRSLETYGSAPTSLSPAISHPGPSVTTHTSTAVVTMFPDTVTMTHMKPGTSSTPVQSPQHSATSKVTTESPSTEEAVSTTERRDLSPPEAYKTTTLFPSASQPVVVSETLAVHRPSTEALMSPGSITEESQTSAVTPASSTMYHPSVITGSLTSPGDFTSRSPGSEQTAVAPDMSTSVAAKSTSTSQTKSKYSTWAEASPYPLHTLPPGNTTHVPVFLTHGVHVQVPDNQTTTPSVTIQPQYKLPPTTAAASTQLLVMTSSRAFSETETSYPALQSSTPDISAGITVSSLSSREPATSQPCTPYTENECIKHICVDGQLIQVNKSQHCPYNVTQPGCGLLGFAVQINGDRCCPRWECACRCSLFSDLSFVTFDGRYLALYKEASYILTLTEDESITVQVSQCGHTGQVTLCLSALELTYISNQIIINRLNRKVVVNSRNAWPMVRKYGYKIVDTGNMYLIDTPSDVKIQWFHSTGLMIIESNSTSRPTSMGLCGFCDGNATNDLILPNGRVLSKSDDSEEFVDSWQVPYTLKYVGKERHRDLNCTVMDCSECFQLILDQAFSSCHPYVSPEAFCELWVKDVAYAQDPCKALTAYVAMCHKFNVCIEWRRPDFCSFYCPPSLIYQACLPVCDITPTCQNNEIDLYGSESCAALTEGCVCAEGEVLHRPYSTVCISESKCACTDSTGTPREIGEVWRLSGAGCCAYQCVDNDTMVPIQLGCSDTEEPECRRYGEVLVSISHDQTCCPQKLCVCNETLCDGLIPVCRSHEKLTAYYQDGSCCPRYTCECDPEKCNQVDGVRQCREDQTLFAVRTRESCCVRHFCGCNVCSEPVPTCQQGEILTVSSNLTDRCCPTYQCVCDTARCPDITCDLGMSAVEMWTPNSCCPYRTCECSCDKLHKPECSAGEKLEVAEELLNSAGNPCNCTVYKCVKDTVCVSKEHGVLRPGQTVVQHTSEGVCHSAHCTSAIDPLTKYHLINVSSLNCAAKCEANQLYEPPRDVTRCCGRCRNVSCVHTLLNGTVLTHKPGSTWISKCVKYDCTNTPLGPVLVTSAVSCPPFNETECIKMGGYVVSFLDGCCKTCKEDGKFCKRVTVRMTIRKNDCRSNTPVNIVSCDGKCPSASIYNYNINTYARFCKCCRELGLQRRVVQLYCSGNSTWVSYSIQEPTDCSCQWS
ncbi:otogelin [Bufo gargarizans]|uniref:otogelin n=1 Tax=Bufo gargarizans TaxID=30331 RepID=UPI001CF32C85|nr:otogelin [Bufo gargarizans]